MYVWISGRINEVKNKEKRTLGIKKVVVGHINGVVALTGCFYKKMYGSFARPKKSGRNNEVVVRWGSTVLMDVELTKFTACEISQPYNKPCY